MMAGGGRSSRAGGKRAAASSSATASACVYYATTGLLVALCVAGAYFLTSTSAAGADGDAAAAYRHTTRSSFAYEVNPDKEPNKRDDGALLDDPHAKPDDDRDQQHAASDEESKQGSAAVALEDDRREEAHGAEEEKSSVLEDTNEQREESNNEQREEGNNEQREESNNEQREESNNEQKERTAVEEKNLDGGVEEGTNDAAGAGARREEMPQQPEGDPDQPQDSQQDDLDGGEGAEEDKEWSKQAADDARETKDESIVDEWRLCNAKAGADYIPCLDNERAIKKLRPENFRRYEHRERHCPEEGPTCLVPLPAGYRRPVEWPTSRDRVWYANVPHTKLVEVKGHQNWVRASGQYLVFPGGGTQFIHGALHYIDFLQQSVRGGGIAWGRRTRVVLDVGCGVASFGGYLFERDVVTMSFAPKDEHEAQVQMALERGIPAISAVMGSKRLPFPGGAFDLVHCARCRVPWHADGGALLLELDRVLRPGGFFVWSATPVYQKLTEDVQIWKAMSSLTRSMCWERVSIKKDRLNGVGIAFYRKPTTNECYDNRRRQQQPPMCSDDDDADAAWYIRLNSCMHRAPTAPSERGARWPAEWPRRLRTPPYWLNNHTSSSSSDFTFTADLEHWRRVVDRSYLNGLGIDWSRVRNVMDMRATYGG
jgi:SAM-dependent methyltransferase